MAKMEKHFVVFDSPGTFFCESTLKPIDSWDVDKAKQIAKTIKERYSAVPFRFYFITKGRDDTDLDSQIIKTSCLYYLGGKIETLDDVKKRNDPKDDILIRNMENNGYDKIIVNDNSWRVTQPFNESDVILDWERPGK